MDFTLMYPCHDGWDSQGNHDGGACDIGWTSLATSPTYGSKDGKTDIYACADGVVEFEGWYKQEYGGKSYNTICVIIRHPDLDSEKDIISIYFHLSRTLCNIGDRVKMGDVIGKKGDTGNSNGVHLHFQTMAIPKGAEIPENHDGGGWAKWSFYPVPYMRLYPGTYFRSTGKWTLKPAESTGEGKADDDFDSLCIEMANCLDRIKSLKTSLKMARDEYKELAGRMDAMI